MTLLNPFFPIRIHIVLNSETGILHLEIMMSPDRYSIAGFPWQSYMHEHPGYLTPLKYL